MRFATEKVLLPLFVVICFVFSLHYTDGKTSIVIRQLVTPQHVGISPRDDVYAKTYVHGAPMQQYRVREVSSRNVRDVWKLRARRENSPKNYASRYKTWSPYKEKVRVREPPIKDIKPFVKRRRPIPPQPLRHLDNEIIYHRRPSRPHKNRVNNLQRPSPPVEAEDFDSEDFFPEETKRAEAQYAYRDGPRRPVKKRRNPVERKKKPKKPVPYPKPSYDDDDRRIVFDDDRKVLFSEDRPNILRHKPKREPTVSYSTFIQHSPGAPSEVDYDYEDEDDVRSLPNRKKKRRIKKKTNKPRDEAEEAEEYIPEKFSLEVPRYPPLYNDEDYESASRPKIKVKKYKLEQQQQKQPVYGEGHISHQSSSTVYGSPNLFRTPYQEDFVSPHQSSHKVQTFNTVSYPTTQSITNPSQGYRYEPNVYTSYSQPSNIQYNKITQPSQDYSNIYGYSNANSGGYVPGSYVNAPVTTHENLVSSSSSNPYLKYRNYQEQQQSQQSSVYYSPSISSSSSYHKDVTTSYKTSPAYDSTDTFTDFNSNVSNQKKYGTYSSRYSEGGSGIVPSVQYSERPDRESDFLQKHQNLYNNGISGVPIQGDGYMNKDTKKDYDIGYGEFQFDENPA